MHHRKLIQTRNHHNRISLISFVLSAVLLFFLVAFSWGFISAKFQLFPHDNIYGLVDAAKAAKELLTIEVMADRSAHEIIAPAITKGGVTVNKSASYDNDYILMTLYKDSEFIAQIINREGHVVHDWRIPYKSLGLLTAKDTGIPLSKKNLTIHGTYLYENGDGLFVVEGRALVKLNKDSDVLWTIPLPTHHAVIGDLDGSIWTLSRRKVENREEWIPLATQPYWEDEVLHISADGEVMERFSVLDIILGNQYEGILYGGHPGEPGIYHSDPLHLNDIDVLTKEQALHFPTVQKGDIMISMRTINTVFIFDPKTYAIKWSMTGPFHRQHDPKISDDGSLLVFDNRTAYGQHGGGAKYLVEPQDLGYSRLIAIDPITRHIVWEYQGTRGNPFYTSIQGKLDELPNGNVLAVESEGGRVFEVNKENGTIVWEFINLIEKGVVGRVTQAIWLSEDQLSFLDRNQEE